MATWEQIALRNEKAYEALKKEFEDYKSSSIKWSVEDFTSMESDYTISKKQAKIALLEMIRTHDACYGITWTDVEFFISKYGKLKTKK